LTGALLAAAWVAPGVALSAPAWCDVEGAQKLHTTSLEDLYTTTDARDAVLLIVGGTCYPDQDAQAQAKQIEQSRQAWSKKLNMNDADWKDAAEWAQRPQVERNNTSIYATQKRAWSAYTPVDQYGGLKNSTLGDSSKVVDPHYMADAFGAKMTNAGRLAYIEECIRDDRDTAPVRFAMCAADIAAYDPAKLATELRGDTEHDGYQRMSIRFSAYELGPKLAEHAKKVKELQGKDPAYAKMFVLADEATKAWSKADPALVALMSNIDDARTTNSRKASEGCQEKTWDAWKKYVASIPAKEFAALKGEGEWDFLGPALGLILNSTNGYLAGLAMNQCAALDRNGNYLIRQLGGNLSRWPGFRGPRTAALTAITTAGLELDDRDARLEFPDLNRPWIMGSGSSSGGGKGVIASVKKKGDKAEIEFRKEKVKQTRCTKGHYTNRVTQITSSGQLIYQYICTAEVNETIIVAPFPPQTVDARFVGGLEPGQLVVVVEDVVVVAFKKGGSTPVVVGGVEVK
jgi:hypothetical protein